MQREPRAQVANSRSALPHRAHLRTGVCYRQSKRIYQRVRTHGQQGLVHATVGRRSNRAHPAVLRARAMALILDHSSGPVEGAGQRFGPTLAAEHLLAE